MSTRGSMSLGRESSRPCWRPLCSPPPSPRRPRPRAEVPYLTGRVVDEAGILSPAARERIEAALATHEENTTNQVAVLTVPSLGSDSVEEFAVKVFSTWKLGQKGKDNGVLLVVAPQERRMRIEVGYGLEGTLTDGIAGTHPAHVAGAALQGRRLRRRHRGRRRGDPRRPRGPRAGERRSAEPARRRRRRPRQGLGLQRRRTCPGTERILLGAFIFGIIGLFTVIGVLTPGAGWFLYFFLIPFWAMFPIVVVGTRAPSRC